MLKPLTHPNPLAFIFFREKQKGPIELVCPECSTRQKEAPLAVSTFCRKCSAHIKIVGGKAVSQKKEAYHPFADRILPSKAPEVVIKEELKKKPSEEPRTNATDHTSHTAAPPSHPKGDSIPRFNTPATFPNKKPAAQPKKTSLFHRNQGEPRKIWCFDCKASHLISPSSTSALCRRCGSYISLRNYDIREKWNRRIQTRGDVFIHKKGVVTGTTIQCHHLTVEGNFTGGVECSGDLIIRRNSKIMGKVICSRLIIEKRANVEFLNSVQTSECTIDGLVTGKIVCSGRLALEKKAVLTGNIKVGRLAISEGAKHQGQIQMDDF